MKRSRTPAAQLLHLQRSAGNAAVAAAVRDDSLGDLGAVSVQREPIKDGEEIQEEQDQSTGASE